MCAKLVRDARESSNDIRERDAAQVLQDLPDVQAHPMRRVLLRYGQERNDARKERMLCPHCPIYLEYGLTHDYFCMRGAAD